MTDYPYMVSNNKIPQIIQSLQVAAKPARFTLEFLQNMGFASTNDRGIFKKLGFLTDDGVPTMYYDHLHDKTIYQRTLASRMRELYTELFRINTEIYKESETNIKGAISRVTGGDEDSVKRIYSTFKTLCNIADFSQITVAEKPAPEVSNEAPLEISKSQAQIAKTGTEFHYNIQIHLPATTDISVYNAIFRSLKDNLIV